MNNKPENAAVDSFRQSRPKGFMLKRFFALLIDFFVVAFLCQLIFILFGTPDWGHYLRMQDIVRGLPATDPLVVERAKLYEECFITTLGIGVIYESMTLVFFGGSLGKLLLGLRVVSVKSGGNFFTEKLKLVLRSVIKALSIYLLSAIPFIFMCLTAFGNVDGRSGFDIFIGTKTIDVRSNRV